MSLFSWIVLRSDMAIYDKTETTIRVLGNHVGFYTRSIKNGKIRPLEYMT
jgi:hypothetical protein